MRVMRMLISGNSSVFKKTRLMRMMLLGLIVFSISLSSHAAVVSFNPGSKTVQDGVTFTMDLVGTGFNGGPLDGGGIDISFDQTKINVLSVVVNTPDWEFFSSNGSIDNLLGSVTGISFNTFADYSGDVPVFATVEFVATGVGVSALGLAEYGLNPFATGGSPYSSLGFDQAGSITVNAVPVPAAVWLFGSALGLLGWMRRRVK